MIYLRSFAASPHEGHSIARWAPSWFGGDRYALRFLGARGVDGQPLRHLEPEEFRTKYYEYLAMIKKHVVGWLRQLEPDIDLTLCCWCTPERQKGYPTLYCHRILLGHIIEEYRSDVPVKYMDGAENPVWTDSKAPGALKLAGFSLPADYDYRSDWSIHYTFGGLEDNYAQR